jgi:hypothetical protein
MKKKIAFGIAGLCICGLCFLSNCGETIYALAARDVEVVFLVTDAETDKPIPGATVNLLMDADGDPREGTRVKLVTDEHGKASYFRNRVMSEDIIKPFQRTRMTFDLGWAVYSVSAKGYTDVKDQWLRDSRYENLGRIGDNHSYRLQFRVPLQPTANP